MFATPDRFATSKRMGTVGVVELKNVGLRLSGDWGDYPPDYVQIQCAHQLAVTGHNDANVAALIGGNEFRDYTLARDDALIANLIEAEAAFWQRWSTGRRHRLTVRAIDRRGAAKRSMSRTPTA